MNHWIRTIGTATDAGYRIQEAQWCASDAKTSGVDCELTSIVLGDDVDLLSV